MKRMLIAYVTKNKNSGINKYIYNVVDIIKKSYKGFEFDFLTSCTNDDLKEDIESNYGRLFEISSLKHPIKRYKEIKNIININSYDIVYINISESFNICTALAAKKNKVKRIVIHSHTSGPSGDNFVIRNIRVMLNSILKKILRNCGTIFLSCSKKAGVWLFGKKIVNSQKFHVINNTIDINKYKYDVSIRNEWRRKYNINEKDIVLGNIGNFITAKNQFFIFKILEELSQRGNYKLILVGSGKLEPAFKKYIKDKNIEDRVIFTGPIDNVHEVLQAMDVFLFPSIIEGFGIAALEAQASSLLTILSDKVPEEVIVSYDTLKLKLDKKEWVKSILKFKESDRENRKLMNRIYEFDNSYIKQYQYIIGEEENE